MCPPLDAPKDRESSLATGGIHTHPNGFITGRCQNGTAGLDSSFYGNIPPFAKNIEKDTLMGHRTPLYDAHVELGARMIDFGGWDMPVQYAGGILAEHAATRTAAGLFDTCHMGEFRLRAPDVRGAVNKLCTADVRKLDVGRARYCFLTTEEGTVVDDAVVFLVSEEEALFCVNAGDIEADYAHLQAYCPADATLEDESGTTGKIDVQGPRAWECIAFVTGFDFRGMPFFSFRTMTWQGHEMVLSRSGYTGEPGVELFLPAAAAPAMWLALRAAGEGLGILPCGLGARDTLRLEAGLPLYGHELSREVNPVQAGFGRFVNLEKPEAFPGRSALEAGGEAGRVLVGLRIEDRRIPRQGFPVLQEAVEVGVVTSGGPSPTLGGSVAMAYVSSSHAQPGTRLDVDIRGKRVSARVVPLPFYSTPLLRERIVDA